DPPRRCQRPCDRARAGELPAGRPDAARAPSPALVPRHGRDRVLPDRPVGLVLAAARPIEAARQAEPAGARRARGAGSERPAGVRRQRVGMDGDGVRPPAVGDLRRPPDPTGDHQRPWPWGDLQRVHARLPRAVGDDDLVVTPACDWSAGDQVRTPGPGGGGMTLATALILVVWGGVTAYAVLGGADFGAGVLHLCCSTGLAGRRRQMAITAAIGPVWAATHVWLIFVLTGRVTAC